MARKVDNEIERVYYLHGSGVQVSVLDIPKIFTAGREAAAAGVSIEAAVKDAIAKYRTN